MIPTPWAIQSTTGETGSMKTPIVSFCLPANRPAVNGMQKMCYRIPWSKLGERPEAPHRPPHSFSRPFDAAPSTWGAPIHPAHGAKRPPVPKSLGWSRIMMRKKNPASFSQRSLNFDLNSPKSSPSRSGADSLFARLPKPSKYRKTRRLPAIAMRSANCGNI